MDKFYATIYVPSGDKAWEGFTVSYNTLDELTDIFNREFISTSAKLPEVQDSFVGAYTILRNLMPASCSADIKLDTLNKPTITLRAATDCTDEPMTPARSMMAAFAAAVGGAESEDSENYTVSVPVHDLKVISVVHDNREDKSESPKDFTFGLALAKAVNNELVDVVGESPYEIVGTYDASSQKYVTLNKEKISIPTELMLYTKGIINGMFGKQSSGGVHR